MSAARARPPAGRGLAALAALAVAGLSAALTGAAQAAERDPPDVEAQRLVHVLGYVAWDYAGAVERGVVKSEVEYAEQLALLRDAAGMVARIQPAAEAGAGGDLAGRLAALRSLVDAKADAADVAAAATALRGSVSRAMRLAEAPLGRLDATRGATLFREHCATCHGETGRADTRRAATLTPRPADLHDPAVAEARRPERVESAIRFGINGTAMPPFGFLSEGERWDLAFHVVALRHAASPPIEPPAPAYSAVELAVRSDAELLDELANRGVPPERRGAVVDYLRSRAPYEPGAAASPLGSARAALARARTAVRDDDRVAARTALLAAELDGVAAVQPALVALDSALAEALDGHAFLAVRAALEAGASPDAVASGVQSLLRHATYADVALSRPGGGPRPGAVALAAFRMLVLEGAAAVLVLVALALATPSAFSRALRGSLASALLGVATWLAAVALASPSGPQRALVVGGPCIAAALVVAAACVRPLASLGASAPALHGRDVALGAVDRLAASSASGPALGVAGALLTAYGGILGALFACFGASLAGGAAPLLGALAAAALLAGVAWGGAALARRAGFSAPRWLACLLCAPIAGRGVMALQQAGVVPFHGLSLPRMLVLGVVPTVEACAAQGALLTCALFGALSARRGGAQRA